jgi:hypothetical protein
MMTGARCKVRTQRSATGLYARPGGFYSASGLCIRHQDEDGHT